MIKQEHRECRHAQGLNFVAIISLMGWGLGYFGQPHILARFMAAVYITVLFMRVVSVWLDDSVSAAGAVAVGLLWRLRTLTITRALAGR